MDLRQPLTLHILYNDASVVQLKEMGIEPKITDCSAEPVTFLSIDCFTTVEYEDGMTRCTIYSSGMTFNTAIPYKEAEAQILSHIYGPI